MRTELEERNLRQAELFEAYSDVDFALMTIIVNEKYTSGFNDKGCFKCSDYIDITKDDYEPKDIQTIVKAFCDEALNRYMDAWNDATPEEKEKEKIIGEFFHNGIYVEVTSTGCGISFMPIQEWSSLE